MPTDDDLAARLRELHDAYAWAVNAAIEHGRDDLAAQLADTYTDEALELITAEVASACERPDCAHAQRESSTKRRRVGWLRRIRIGRERR